MPRELGPRHLFNRFGNDKLQGALEDGRVLWKPMMPMEKCPATPSRYYPLFLSLEGKTCLVVGGGAVGERKVGTLLKYGPAIRLVARQLSAGLEEMRTLGLIDWIAKGYEKSLLDGISLVFAATDDLDLNRAIAADAFDRGLWCNMATEPERGSFIVPSVFERGMISVAVSTAGGSPAVAKLLRQKLELEIGSEWDFFVRLLYELRQRVKDGGIVEKEGRELLARVARLPIPQWLAEGRAGVALAKTVQSCGPVMTADQTRALWENVWNLFSS